MRPADDERQRDAGAAAPAQRQRHHPDVHADDHDADVRRGEAQRHDRAAAHLAASPTAQIVLGKFLGAFALYALMLAVSAAQHRPAVRATANPEWRPIVTGYLGLLLIGGGFIAIGLFFSNLTRNQIVAGLLTFATAPAAAGEQWVAESAGPIARGSRVGAVDDRSLRGFLERHHRHEARHLLPERDHVRAVPDGQSRSMPSGGAGSPDTETGQGKR